MELNKRIKDFWEEDAEGYSEGIGRELESSVKDAWVNLILEYAPKKEKLDILDVGTGPGFFPIVLTQAGHNVTGTDITENMIACAEDNLKKLGLTAVLLTMDCQNLTFSDNSFDLIICRNLTWTLDNPEKAYSEWFRVLRPGGRVLIFDACWYLHLSGEDASLEYEQKVQEINDKYGDGGGRRHYNLPELDSISKELFMSDKIRPQWDMNALLAAGFSKVFADVTVGSRYAETERQKVMQALHPPFAAGGEK